jgi:hypothetical protein
VSPLIEKVRGEPDGVTLVYTAVEVIVAVE